MSTLELIVVVVLGWIGLACTFLLILAVVHGFDETEEERQARHQLEAWGDIDDDLLTEEIARRELAHQEHAAREALRPRTDRVGPSPRRPPIRPTDQLGGQR